MSPSPLDELLVAEERYLRASGWLPAKEVGPRPESACDDDWVPPWDRANPWDRDRAIEEQRGRDEARTIVRLAGGRTTR